MPKPAEAIKRVQLSLPPDLCDRCQAEAQAQGLSFNEWARRIFMRALTQPDPEKGA